MREERTIGKRQERRSRMETEQLLDAFEASGLRRREFCVKRGIALGTLDFWRKRRRLERGTVADTSQAKTDVEARAKGPSSRLVAVEIAGLAEGTRTQTSVGGLAVVVSRGRRIEVTRGFDAATLERLLDVLERG